jgi:ParB-like chromosome segregation protein Spo0J
MNDLKVCMWPIDRPIPYARNSRKIPERSVDKVAASIKEFGWRQAIVVDRDRVIGEGVAAGIGRCRREIAEVEAQIRAGHTDLEGLLLALSDWSAELRLLAKGE